LPTLLKTLSSRDLNVVLQGVVLLTSVIGKEMQSSCTSLDDMVLCVMRLICTAKPKIRGAANKALQKALASWPAETNAAVARADDEWRTNELVQKLLVAPPVSESLRSQSQSLALAGVVVTAVAVPSRDGVEAESVTVAIDESTDIAVVAVGTVGVGAVADVTHADVKVKTKPAVVKRAAVEEDVYAGKVGPADSFDSMVVGKSNSSNMNSADMYGSERLDGPYNALLDLLNSYVRHLYSLLP